MRSFGRAGVVAALLCALAACVRFGDVKAAGGPVPGNGEPYRVLPPIESGNLLLFPVVRADSKEIGAIPFLTLDEGFKSGEVEVTEAGRAAGLVRPRGDGQVNRYRGDEVNTLVLVNHSKRPLLLLAGEIVTGGKQDRIIAKDRIVPPDADPIDLSVFCIEPGRWTGATASFGASANAPAKSFMVQPEVREKAMSAQDQVQVWNAVHGAISQMEVAAAPPPVGAPSSGGGVTPRELGTSSYAKAMQSTVVSEKVDEAAAPVMQGREQVLAKLREEHAVGVVVAVRGEIIWADLFANTDLLARYWTKLVRSYAAESLAAGEDHAAPSVADAQHFLDMPAGGKETSEGDVGIYRYRDLKSDRSETFVLESLLPGADYEVHISKMKLRGDERRAPRPRPDGLPPLIEPPIYR